MKLYYYPYAPYSRKVLLAAHERGVTFERDVCAPFIPTDKKRLKAAHPLATVPLLVDGDDVFTESSLIVEHFDLVAGDDRPLIPRDPRRALPVRAMDRFGDSHLMGPTAYIAWASRKPEEKQNTEKLRAQRDVIDIAMRILEGICSRQAFLVGEELSLGDLSPAAAISCMLVDKTLATLDPWPNVERWYKGIIERPSFVAILDECKTVPLPPGF
jgi:glutathione S-transferase